MGSLTDLVGMFMAILETTVRKILRPVFTQITTSRIHATMPELWETRHLSRRVVWFQFRNVSIAYERSYYWTIEGHQTTAARQKKPIVLRCQTKRSRNWKNAAHLTLRSVKIDSVFSAYKPIVWRYQRELIKHQQKASRNCEEKKLAKQ